MKQHYKIRKPHLDIINYSVKQNFTREYSSALTFAISTTNKEAFHQSYNLKVTRKVWQEIQLRSPKMCPYNWVEIGSQFAGTR